MFEFLVSTGVPQDWIILALNVAGISEGKESFAHCLVRLMCDTRDHPNAFPQSIVNNSCTVHLLISYIPHAITIVKLVSQVVHFHVNNNF